MGVAAGVGAAAAAGGHTTQHGSGLAIDQVAGGKAGNALGHTVVSQGAAVGSDCGVGSVNHPVVTAEGASTR